MGGTWCITRGWGRTFTFCIWGARARDQSEWEDDRSRPNPTRRCYVWGTCGFSPYAPEMRPFTYFPVPIADSGPAGEDFYPERPSRVNDLSSNPKKDFNPACTEPRRTEHPDERTASSAYGVYPDPVGVPLRLVLLRLSAYNLKLTTYNRERRGAAKKELAGKCYGVICFGKALGPVRENWKRMSHSLGTL